MRLLFGGDWNAAPGDRDRFRPRWIAGRRLQVESAGPGAFGDIDYVLTDAVIGRTDAEVGRMVRLGRHGSDHDLVMFDVRGDLPYQQLGGATWNVLAGRDPREVARTLVSVMRRYRLDFVLLQEATGYHNAIRRAGVDLVGFSAVPGESQNPIAVRSGVHHTTGHTRRLSRDGWPLASGNLHAPIYATACTLDGWLRAWSLHLPNYERGDAHATAYRQAARRLRRAARRHVRSARHN